MAFYDEGCYVGFWLALLEMLGRKSLCICLDDGLKSQAHQRFELAWTRFFLKPMTDGAKSAWQATLLQYEEAEAQFCMGVSFFSGGFLNGSQRDVLACASSVGVSNRGMGFQLSHDEEGHVV